MVLHLTLISSCYVMATISEIDSELMSELGRIAAQGRKALEVHPESPFSSGWSRDQYRHGERATFLNDSEPDYEDIVQLDGPDGETNPFGVLNYWLIDDVDDYTGTVCDYIWDKAEAGNSTHPARELGFRHPHDVRIEAEELSTFIDYALGCSTDQQEVSQAAMQEMCQKGNRLEDYFDRLTASF